MFAPGSRSRQSESNAVDLRGRIDGSVDEEGSSTTAAANPTAKDQGRRPAFVREYSEMGMDGGKGGSIVEGISIRHVGHAESSGTNEQRKPLLRVNGEEYGTMATKLT